MNHPKLIPRLINEVTPEWLEKVFILHNAQIEDVKSAKVIEVKPVTQILGYLSTTVRGTIQLSGDRTIKVFIKVNYRRMSTCNELVLIFICFQINDKTSQLASLTNDLELDVTEIKTYRDVFQRLVSFEKEEKVLTVFTHV